MRRRSAWRGTASSRSLMKKSAFTLALTAAAIAVASLFQPAAVRAAEVTITSGSAVVNCTGNPNADTGRIELIGEDFNFLFRFDGVFGGFSCSPAPVRVNLTTVPFPPYDGVIEFVTYQGVTTMFTRGSLFFDETSITGFVEGTNFLGDVVLFTVNFSGAGTGSFSTSRSTFEVGAVPEPTTLALLGIGAALFSGTQRLRNRRKATRTGSDSRA